MEIKRNALKMTRQRQVILDALMNSRRHPTADDVYETVRSVMPRISLGTVYRNLETMTELGMIARIEVGGHQRRYDAITDDHAHIRCVACGRVDDVMAKSKLVMKGDVRRETGYDVLSWRIEFAGRCPSCRPAPGKPAKGPRPSGRAGGKSL